MGALADARKAILKLKGEELAGSQAFQDAVDLVTKAHARSDTHDLLALQLVIFRHLRAAVLTADPAALSFVSASVRTRLGPALSPASPMAEVMIYSVDSSDKISLLRASDVLGAACRLALDLAQSRDPTGRDLLVPLFQHVANGPLTGKGSLVIINQTVECVPLDAVSEDDLLKKVVSQLASADYASIRSSIFASHWLKKVAGNSADTNVIEQDMLQGILPHLTNDDGSAHSIVMARNLSKYLLPAVFKAFPKSCLTLLGLLESDGAHGGEEDGAKFRSWIRVASLGSSLGFVGLGDLKRTQVIDAIGHADSEIRRQAFELLAGQHDTNAVLSAESFELFKLVLQYNAVLPASSTRTEWASALHLFFTRLVAAQLVAKRHARRPTGAEQEKVVAVEQLARLAAFFEWMFTDIIDPALISARRPPSYRVIVGLITLQTYTTIFASEAERAALAFTPYRVHLLIGCQACEFAEVRARSHAILKMAPTPLPGYASLDELSARTLLTSAWTGFANPRKTQNDAAVAALQIVFERVVLAGTAKDEPTAAVAFVSDVADRLEQELQRVEGAIQGGLEDLALHGPVAGCRALVACIDLTDPQNHVRWQPLFHRLLDFVHRIWRLTGQVMSLSSSAAGGGEADGPAHEIAKAYQVLSSGQDEEANDDMDPRKLLSGCWRATKEAGELLATIIDCPLSQAGARQILWRKEQVDAAGRTFLQWLHEVRHRGTFSAISAAFAELVEAVKKVKDMQDLPGLWLDLEIAAITDDTLSTTRRSAALPYSLLSIVAGDETLLSSAVHRLLDLARIDNTKSSDITKVHAFNILKIVLLDAKQSKFLPKYFEDTVMTAVQAFPSPNWNVRNVALMLFSTLVNRSLQSARTSQHMYASRAALEGRQTFASWHSKYPRILPYIAAYLRRYRAGQGAGGHTALFPMLIILRSLKWGPDEEGLQAELRAALDPYLVNPEWQVRQVAAQSLSSLYSPAAAISAFVAIDLSQTDNLDLQHGRACLARNLMVNTLSSLDSTTLQTVSASLKSMIEHVQAALQREQAHLVGPIETEVWATYAAFVQTTAEPDTTGSQIALELLQADTTSATMPVLGQVERDHARVQAAFCTSDAPVEPSDRIALLSHRSDAVIARLLKENEHSTAALRLSGEAVAAVMRVAVDEKPDHELRLQAMRWLCDVNSDARTAGLRAMGDSSRAEVLQLFQAMLGSRNTLLREQGMVVFAWALAGSVMSGVGHETAGGIRSSMGLLAQRIAHCAKEDKPSREAAALSLSHIAPSLFLSSSTTSPTSSSPIPSLLDPSSLLACQQAVLALLQDDDEDIRLLVADSVRVQLEATAPVCQTVAHGMWWRWCERHLASLQGSEKEAWVRWISHLARDEEGFDDDDLALHPERRLGTKTELFEEEKPNLFRDPLDDARAAASALAVLVSPRSQQPEARPMSDAQRFSPIDGAFSARAIMPIREALRASIDAR